MVDYPGVPADQAVSLAGKRFDAWAGGELDGGGVYYTGAEYSLYSARIDEKGGLEMAAPIDLWAVASSSTH